MDLENLKECKRALNELINQQWSYINSTDTTEEQRCITKKNMTLTYSTLGEILELISKEENK
jgi:hypothetical protein